LIKKRIPIARILPHISTNASYGSMVLPKGKIPCNISIEIPKKHPARKINKNFVSVLFLVNIKSP
jgi:hypothetical protein